MDALLLMAATSNSVGYAGRGDFAMAPDGRLRRRTGREMAPFERGTKVKRRIACNIQVKSPLRKPRSLRVQRDKLARFAISVKP